MNLRTPAHFVLPLATLLAAGSAFAQPPQETAIRATANRGIALIQKSTANWTAGCFSCHHQALTMMALGAARQHGLAVDEKAAQAASNRDLALAASVDDALRDGILIDPSSQEGYLLVAARAAGIEPNLSLALYARRIANHQRDDGHWTTFDNRPPQGESRITATAIAARGVSLYMPPQLATTRQATLSRAHQWLRSAKSESTEDLTFRILGLHWTAPDGKIPADLGKALAAEALKRQRPDGGWSQVAARSSDCYATGQILYALAETGLVAPSDPAYQRGLAYLIKTQSGDGAWHVTSRMKTKVNVSPPYMETGYPYGHDQFVSISGATWAIMALAAALPAKPAAPLPVTAATVRGELPWMSTVLFGSTADLDRALKTGLDPNAASAGGTTVLMMAAHDPEKVKLLLARGAKATARAKSGYDALMIASLFRRNTAAMTLLLDAKAEVNPTKTVFNATPLTLAAFTGDAEPVELLLKRGAKVGNRMMLLGMVPANAFDIACSFESPSTIKLLAANGAQVDEVDPQGLTQLSLAALAHKNESVRALLEAGANPNHVDKLGLTPLQHTAGIEHLSPETAELLKQRGAGKSAASGSRR